MHVCPLEWRYGTKEMRRILSNIYSYYVKVEVALLYGLSKAKIIPIEVNVKDLEKKVKGIDLSKVSELERISGHEIDALVQLLSEALGEYGAYVHLGATSNDIIDTAWALMLRDALSIIKDKLSRIIRTLIDMSLRYKNTLMIGRTHGQHALPITLGFKLANYVYEFSRSLERIMDVEKRVIRGKISGAVGTMAAWRDKGLLVEKYTLSYLGLEPHIISTQVAPRDGFAELVSVLAILASQLDRFAIEVRELMRPEIHELLEGTPSLVGSSTMPHKRNPITSERISGLAKVMRSLTIVALENIPLWHERDLTNSSSERIIIPHALLIVDEMLKCMIKLLNSLIVDGGSMRKNLELLNGITLSEAIMIKLVEKGVPRLKAHRHLINLVKESYTTSKLFKELLLSDEFIAKYLTKEEIENLLKPENYLGVYDKLIERAIQYAENVLGKLSKC